jgi:ubiquinone/menaquinone biosynthesis C-methylase UbiE
LKNLTDDELKSLASQLRCPSGELGLEVADMMNDSNGPMIKSAISSISPTNGDSYLELGPGNGYHVKELLDKHQDSRYTALDISSDMIKVAQGKNSSYKSRAKFMHYNGTDINYPENSFDKIFTVNTLYFWQNPEKLMSELSRVLKPRGVLCIAFGKKSFLETLPFIKHGFTLYETTEVEQLAIKSGLTPLTLVVESDRVLSKAGEEVSRQYNIFTFSKDK